MKKKNLLTTLAMSAAVATFAAVPVQVEFNQIPNPTGDPENPFPLYIAYGQELWGDYNNDGKLDRFIIGGNGKESTSFYLYKNEGSFFTKVETEITRLANATAALFDYDNDGNLDILIVGKNSEETNTNEMWRNTGEAGEYAFVKDETFPNFGVCDHEGQSRCNFLSVADFDNDGWIDIFVSGWAPDGEWKVRLYRNDQGYFEEIEHPVDDSNGRGAFRQILTGSVQTADLNNDGYVDLILSGEDRSAEYEATTTVYFNNGDGTFREIANPANFQGQKKGTTFVADINNDGYPDIIEMGDNDETGRDLGDGRKRVANVYINNGNDTFGEAMNAENNGILEMRAMPSVGDVNNDGLVDILATGGWEDDFMHLFYNTGEYTFTDTSFPQETSGREGVASLVDFDGDGALDISVEGWAGDWRNELLINDWAEGLARPQAPTIPTGFTVTQDGENVILSWEKATDDTTPADAIRYNIYIQAKEAEADGYQFTYTYAPVNIETGFLTHTGKPHFISSTTITMKGFNAANYNFGVQAVDNGWLASAFATVSGSVGMEANELANIIVRADNGKISLENANEATYNVYGINGQAIAMDVAGNTSTGIATGTYIVKITSENDTIIRKVVVL